MDMDKNSIFGMWGDGYINRTADKNQRDDGYDDDDQDDVPFNSLFFRRLVMVSTKGASSSTNITKGLFILCLLLV
jgi:hypothetical protein